MDVDGMRRPGRDLVVERLTIFHGAAGYRYTDVAAVAWRPDKVALAVQLGEVLDPHRRKQQDLDREQHAVADSIEAGGVALARQLLHLGLRVQEQAPQRKWRVQLCKSGAGFVGHDTGAAIGPRRDSGKFA